MPDETTVLGRGGVLVRSATGTETDWRGFRHEEYAPFLLRFADIDGDGETEIVAGVFDRGERTGAGDRGRMRQQLHIFRWRANRLVPLWFCGRRYRDFQLASLGGRIRLLELAHARSVFVLRIYQWRGFGWWQDAAIDLGADPVSFRLVGGNVVLERADGRRVEVGWDDDRAQPRIATR